MTTGAVWPSSLCHCRHKGACPLAAGSPNGCMVEEENKHRDSETGQNQAVSAGLQRSKTLNKSSAASAWHCTWPGKGGWGKRRAGLLLLLPTAVKQAAHPRNISENDRGRKKKTSRNGQFSKGESHCNYTSCENIIPSRLSSAVLYFLRINLQRALACLSLHCSGATR